MRDDCEHAVHTDPRFPTTCIKCGKAVFRPRNVAIEKHLHGLADLPEDLLELVHRRTAQSPYGSQLLQKDWLAELNEELADAVNYLTWLIQDERPVDSFSHRRALRQLGELWLTVNGPPYVTP